MPHRARDTISVVIAGLDPAIHHLRKTLAKRMDTRVKPAYDAACVAASCENFRIQNFKQQPRFRDLATPCARALPVNVPPSSKRGRAERRAPSAPAASHAK